MTLDRDLQALLERADPAQGAGSPGEPELALERLWRRIEAEPPAVARRRRRGRPAGAALAGLAAAAGAVAVVGGGGDGGVATASAAEIVHAALGALDPPPILHLDVVGTQVERDGPTVRWEDEGWSQTTPPYDARQIETDNDGHVAETAVADGREELYDSARNAIYRLPPPPIPRYDIRAGGTPGTYTLTLPRTISLSGLRRVLRGGGAFTGPGARGTTTVALTDAQRRKLLAGQATIQWRSYVKRAGGAYAEHPYVAPVARPQHAADDGFRGQALKLLRSPGVAVDQQARLHGRAAVRIASADGRTVYFVAPGTFTPLELRTRGEGGSVTLRFRAYEQLPGTPANRRLLSLDAQHPGATVDRRPADYDAAQARLFPHG